MRLGLGAAGLLLGLGVANAHRLNSISVQVVRRALDAQFPLDPRQTSSCSRQARNGAMAQVRAAIAAAAKNSA